jgi:hypothetical protein
LMAERCLRTVLRERMSATRPVAAHTGRTLQHLLISIRSPAAS